MADEKTEFRKKLLLKLAKVYVEGKDNNAVGLVNETQAEREVISQLKAEGSITEYMKGVRFTKAGYNKYLATIDAWKAMGEES
jgi:hypothetical protein